MSETPKKPINSVKVRMYKMGTGDCISLKFMHDEEVTFTMLFDCGCIKGSKSKLTPFIQELIQDLDEHVDVLVITHEHQDHVLGFERCEDLFYEGLSVGELWMAWTEDDSRTKVKKWKKEYGQKKMALALSAKLLKKEINSSAFKNQFKNSKDSNEILSYFKKYAFSLQEFSELHVNEDESEYKGPLKGMRFVKENLVNKHDIDYLYPGDFIDDIEGLDGVNIYVLGPPTTYSEVNKESGNNEESYRHNKELDPEDYALDRLRSEIQGSDYFSDTINSLNEENNDAISPFPAATFSTKEDLKKSSYTSNEDAWRRIDYEWLNSSANLALRMNSLTNNLSLVLAIEFKESGKVMLFPGDAEYGSWESWHNIDWSDTIPGSHLTTEDLLSRVVFYKVAHHLSHNGTARRLGLEMMDHPDLIAMATLNYDVISSGWKNTMPNREILKTLLEKTKGRFLIQNTDDLYFDLDDKIPLKNKIKEYQQLMYTDERKEYNNSIIENKKYIEIAIKL